MHAFVVSGLVFSTPSQEIGLGKPLRNDLFCVEWDVKPHLSKSIDQLCLEMGYLSPEALHLEIYDCHYAMVDHPSSHAVQRVKPEFPVFFAVSCD